MIKLNAYIIFSGKAGEAMLFYQNVFGGELKMQKYSEANTNISEDEENRIIHAYLRNDEIEIMASDDNSKNPVKIGNNIHLSLSGPDIDRLVAIFYELSKEGKVDVPLKKEFWGATFGMITDKFGIHWMINITEEKNEIV